MEPTEQPRRIPLVELRRFLAEALRALDVPAEEAEIVARVMADADLRGVYTHGAAMLRHYSVELKSGGFNPRPRIQVVSETAATALVDGDRGLGHLIGVRAMELAIRKAGELGAAWVGVRNSHHWGAAAHYASLALDHDMIGLAITVGAGRCMTPPGGLDILVGNNPFAIAVPAAQEPPVVLDMATSVVARGKIMIAARKGESIPLGWAVDEDGRPTTDAVAAYEGGSLLPIGGYKGYGLSVMVALLAGALTGAAIGSEQRVYFDVPGNNGHLLGAIKVDGFMPAAQFRERVDWHVRELKDSRRAPGVDRIYVPGEIEHETALRQLREGIALPSVVEKDVWALAGELGVLPPEPLA